MIARRVLWMVCWMAGIAAASAAPAPVSSPPLQPLQIPGSAPPTFTAYSGRDGLGDEIWDSIGFDARGFVWAGSASSLAWFDGYRWHPWALAKAPGLVGDMARARDGTLWAIFMHEGLAHFDGHAWHVVPETSAWVRFAPAAPGSDVDLWVVGDAGLMYLRDGTWHADPGNAALQPLRPDAIGTTRALFGGRRQWVAASGSGLWYREIGATGVAGPWHRFDAPQLAQMPITDFLDTVDREGREELWVVSYGGGIARIRADGIKVWTTDSGGLPLGAMYSIVQTHDSAGLRQLWIASRHGLLLVRGDGAHIDLFDRRNGLPSNAVRGLKVQRLADGSQVLWLATEGGVARAVLNDTP